MKQSGESTGWVPGVKCSSNRRPVINYMPLGKTPDASVLDYLFYKSELIEFALLISLGCHEIIDTRNFAVQM